MNHISDSCKKEDRFGKGRPRSVEWCKNFTQRPPKTAAHGGDGGGGGPRRTSGAGNDSGRERREVLSLKSQKEKNKKRTENFIFKGYL